MLEILVTGGEVSPYEPVDWIKPVESVPGKSYRLVYVSSDSAATNGMIGCHEFQLFDAQNRNLCRTAGFIPDLGWTRKLTQGVFWDPVTHGPDKTIDGNTSDWKSTCYGGTALDRTAFIQYTFKDDFTPTRWTFKCEGSYMPGTNAAGNHRGVQLHRLSKANIWEDITGTPAPSGTWTTGSTKTFTLPVINN